jgi:4-hydroxybenzoate polyprenyltransferase
MSPRDLIVRYLRERGRPTALIALSLLMAGTGWASRDTMRMTPIGFALAALTAFLLVLAFRVWDDLEDRAYDANQHPTRITVVAGSVAPLGWLACALVALAASLVIATPKAPLRLTALCASALVLAVWYRSRSQQRRGLANSHVVLLKYPALAFAAVPVSPSLTALGVLYVGLCAYEAVDDPSLRRSLVARRLAISEVALMSTIIAGVRLLGGRLP